MAQLDYNIISTDSSNLTIQVQFLNPRYSGTHITTEEYTEAAVEGEEPITKTREIDNDPNPHMTKTINVPIQDGVVDQEALDLILEQQAMGVKHRMDSAYQNQSNSIDLSSLVE